MHRKHAFYSLSQYHGLEKQSPLGVVQLSVSVWVNCPIQRFRPRKPICLQVYVTFSNINLISNESDILPSFCLKSIPLF